jgi:hypothetical protein
MSILKMMFGKFAPAHYAEPYVITHDGTLNLVEARRGRGKSYGAVMIALAWLKERLPAIQSGAAPHAKIYTNNRFNLRRMALHCCQQGWIDGHAKALKLLSEIIIYFKEWNDLLTSYDSLILCDEANRNLNTYDNGKDVQVLMLTVHDWLQQTRKHKLTLWFFVQYLDWIKPQVKMLMDRLWRAKRVRDKKTGIPKYFPWYGSDPFANGVGSEVVRHADFKMKFMFKVELARIYDSWQAIETLPMKSEFRSFAEISDHMYATGRKPAAPLSISEALTHAELVAWFSDSSPAPASVLPASAGGAGVGVGAVELPLPLDLSSLATSYPKELL